MDNSIVVIDDSLRRSDSVASTSKFGSLVQINSIAIDISSSMEVIEPPKHEHFTIRGFVAGMRKKDQKTCLPFPSEGNDVDVVDNPPPLIVPRFRWWQCSNCIPDIKTKRTPEEMVVATRIGAGTDFCQNVGDKNSLDRSESTGNKVGKTDIKDQEAGNDDNPLQIIERLHNTTDASDMVCVTKHPLVIVDEADDVSSGSDGTFNALPHRRKPKLRSLADIMVKERKATSNNSRTRSASSCGMQVASIETEAVLGPQPEVDVVVDVAKSDASPERKRKIDLREDGGPLGMVYPCAAAKRIKGPMLDVGKNYRRVEVSHSKSEGYVSKNQQVKPKKTKALDIIKKMRQSQRENEIAPVGKFPQINAACSANLQKYNVSQETNLGEVGHDPSRMRELMGTGFRTSQSEQQIEKIYSHSNGKIGEVGPSHDALVPRKKSNLEDFNIREKVALDLSLNSFMDTERNLDNQASFRHYRGIPDLNEESPEKTAMAQGQQLTNVSEKRSLPLNKTLDVSAFCSIKTARDFKEQSGISELKNIEHCKELGASDDIPMEIVELLAQNQHERALENSRKHFLGINNSTRGYSALCVDGRPSLINFPLDSRNGLTAANGNMGLGKKFPVNFTQTNKEDSQFRHFSFSVPNQHRQAHYAASNSTIAGPDLFRSSTKNNAQCHLSIAPKHHVQPSGMRAHSLYDRYHKGKNVSYSKDDKEKRAVHNAAAIKEQKMGTISTSIGSLDPYSNDTIPAMQLLSLMDPRVVSGSSFEVNTEAFLDKSFSSCNHRPCLNGKENQNFLSRSFFSQNGHSKDFSGLRYGVYRSGESSKKVSSNLTVQIPHKFGKSEATLLEGSSDLIVQPVRNESALGVCRLNRNPADFSIPNSRNEFTLTAKDLKFRKKNTSKEKSRTEGWKKQKMRKDSLGKECLRK